MIQINEIKCQYNPKRFDAWKSLHLGKIKNVLDIEHSPHVRFLKEYIDSGSVPKNSAYHKMHKLYGRNNIWINKKVITFIKLYNTIKTEGYNGSVELLKQPKHKNKYNNSFEIWEGHHRCSICFVLGYEEIECKIL
jgi:hypothetical protein